MNNFKKLYLMGILILKLKKFLDGHTLFVITILFESYG